MTIHNITLAHYRATCGEQPLRLGTAGSYGIEQLQVHPREGWEDLAISVTFIPAGLAEEAAPMALPDGSGIVAVPQRATAVPGPGVLVFAGAKDGVQRITCDLPYQVEDHGSVPGQSTEDEPTGLEVLLQAADAANAIAAELEQKLVSGAFTGQQGPAGPAGADGQDGAPGPKGDPGVTPAMAIGTVSTLSAGAQATASITGTAAAPVLHLGIPTGAAGPAGPAGGTGPQGPAGATGPQGPQGNAGPQGPAGADGHTPVRGADYWTSADQAAIIADVKAALPTETWTFTLEDDATVTKKVVVMP